MRSTKRNLVMMMAVMGLMIATTPANATFPGKNGRIAFIQNGEVFTMNPDGSDIKQLTHLAPDNSATYPAWSPDGRQIVFNESTPPDGTPQIWVMDANGGDQHVVFAEQDYAERRPSFSPDGSQIVFARCKLFVGDGDTCAIYTVGINGSGLAAVTRFHRDTTARNPMYSPDGKTIAFILSNDTVAGFFGVTYLVDADGSNQRRITEPEPCLIRPDWSPDGTKITTFAHFCNPENETIAVMNADGSKVRYLTHNGSDYFSRPHDSNPAFSPDGEFIVFQRDAPDFSSSAIYVMKVDGSGQRCLALFSHTNDRWRDTRRNMRHQLTKIEDGGTIPRWGVRPD